VCVCVRQLNAPSVPHLSVYRSTYLINRSQYLSIELSPPQTQPSIVPRFHTQKTNLSMIYLSITSSDAAKHSSPLSHKNLTRVSLLFKKNTTTEFQGLRLRKKTLPLYRCFQKKNVDSRASLSHKVLNRVLLLRNTNNNNNNNNNKQK